METQTQDSIRKRRLYQCVVMGASAGGLGVLTFLVSSLPEDFPLPILIALHRGKHHTSSLAALLQPKARLTIAEALDKDLIVGSKIFFAPPDYHMLVESQHEIALSIDDEVNFCRPSIDVLFESAADVFGPALIGVLLSGSNHDGAAGLKKIRDFGGHTIVQSVEQSEFPTMPAAAIALGAASVVLEVPNIPQRLLQLSSMAV